MHSDPGVHVVPTAVATLDYVSSYSHSTAVRVRTTGPTVPVVRPIHARGYMHELLPVLD